MLYLSSFVATTGALYITIFHFQQLFAFSFSPMLIVGVYPRPQMLNPTRALFIMICHQRSRGATFLIFSLSPRHTAQIVFQINITINIQSINCNSGKLNATHAMYANHSTNATIKLTMQLVTNVGGAI